MASGSRLEPNFGEGFDILQPAPNIAGPLQRGPRHQL